MPSILDLNLSERKEITTLPRGEYRFRILGAKAILSPDDDTDQPDWKGRRINIRCEAVDYPLTDDVYYQLFLPNSQDSEKSVWRKKGDISSFLDKIGLDPDLDRVDLTEWVGCEFMAIGEPKIWNGKERFEINEIYKS